MTNGILQVSENVKYSFIPGNTAQKVVINGELLNENQEYWVAAPNFVTQGGDGYLEFNNSLEYIDSGVLVVDATESFLKSIETYRPKYDGRIKVLD